MRVLVESLGAADVVAEAQDGLEAIALCRKHKPDLLVLDVGMPHANGSEVFADVRRWSPETRIAVFTGFTSTDMLADWVAAGVDGLFLKSCAEEELKRGLILILSGGKYVMSDISERLRGSPDRPELTDREREVLALIATGLTTKQIGDRLSISPKTIEKHRGALFEKFEVGSVAALLTASFKAGMFDYLVQT
ncbi:response regulator transcription factor [Altererythrobacter sp. ZODW24]|uniref:response regulator n=1 Tax=Altererythrobacter sp. ZODW24 TaxID=2185142 RepID=UPI000DF81AEA|nr:response regulator transcription factor [Altererythrobacter sp. ZODW24]